MEIDQAKAEEQDDEEMPEPMTPEQSDNETDQEDEPVPDIRGRSTETLRASSAVAPNSKSDATDSTGVPPPRALPFTKRVVTRSKQVHKQPSPAADDDDDDDDQTDDEEL
jgi:hypothetical protein